MNSNDHLNPFVVDDVQVMQEENEYYESFICLNLQDAHAYGFEDSLKEFKSKFKKLEDVLIEVDATNDHVSVVLSVKKLTANANSSLDLIKKELQSLQFSTQEKVINVIGSESRNIEAVFRAVEPESHRATLQAVFGAKINVEKNISILTSQLIKLENYSAVSQMYQTIKHNMQAKLAGLELLLPRLKSDYAENLLLYYAITGDRKMVDLPTETLLVPRKKIDLPPLSREIQSEMISLLHAVPFSEFGDALHDVVNKLVEGRSTEIANLQLMNLYKDKEANLFKREMLLKNVDKKLEKLAEREVVLKQYEKKIIDHMDDLDALAQEMHAENLEKIEKILQEERGMRRKIESYQKKGAPIVEEIKAKGSWIRDYFERTVEKEAAFIEEIAKRYMTQSDEFIISQLSDYATKQGLPLKSFEVEKKCVNKKVIDIFVTATVEFPNKSFGHPLKSKVLNGYNLELNTDSIKNGSRQE